MEAVVVRGRIARGSLVRRVTVTARIPAAVTGLLVAALGEVKESLGEKFAKEKILQKYREEFPRHSSFHGALRANGMRDSRKGKRKNLEDIKLDDFGQ